MQYFALQGMLIDSLYKGQKTTQGKREGFGWQLFLNGFMYIGNWRNDRAFGNGSFIYNDGTFMYGEFWHNDFMSGTIRFASGACYNGTMEGRGDGRFGKGTFHTANGYKIDIECQNGNLMRGTIHRNPTLPPGAPAADRVLRFDFTNRNARQPNSGARDSLILPGERGLILEHDSCYIKEGQIHSYTRNGDFYGYKSATRYVSCISHNGSRKTYSLLRMSDMKQVKIRETGDTGAPFEFNFFSGITVDEAQLGEYFIYMKWIESDYITLDAPLSLRDLEEMDVLLKGGWYNYTDSNGRREKIRFERLMRVDQHPLIHSKRVKFDVILGSIFNRRPKTKNLVEGLFKTDYDRYYKMWEEFGMRGARNQQPSGRHFNDGQIVRDTSAPNDDAEGFSRKAETGSRNKRIAKRRGLKVDKDLDPLEAIDRTGEQDPKHKPRARNTEANRLESEDKQYAKQPEDERKGKSPRQPAVQGNQMTLEETLKLSKVTNKKRPNKDPETKQTPRPDNAAPVHYNNTLNNISISQHIHVNNPCEKKSSLSLADNFTYSNKPAPESDAIESLFEAGVLRLPDQRSVKIIEGRCVDSKLEGPCKIEFCGRVSVLGTFSEGRLDGYAVIGNGEETYAGDFRANKPIGRFQMTKDNKSTPGTFKNGVWVPMTIREVCGVPVELNESHIGPLNGTYIVKLIDYDLTCAFKNNELVPKQKPCLLKRRDDEDTYKGELLLEKEKQKFFFITENRVFYTIDIKSRKIEKL